MAMILIFSLYWHDPVYQHFQDCIVKEIERFLILLKTMFLSRQQFLCLTNWTHFWFLARPQFLPDSKLFIFMWTPILLPVRLKSHKSSLKPWQYRPSIILGLTPDILLRSLGTSRHSWLYEVKPCWVSLIWKGFLCNGSLMALQMFHKYCN